MHSLLGQQIQSEALQRRQNDRPIKQNLTGIVTDFHPSILVGLGLYARQRQRSLSLLSISIS